MSALTTELPSEVRIFESILKHGAGSMQPALARYVLQLGFSEADHARIRELTERNEGGTISPPELEELLGFAKAGCLLGILHSQARKSLNRSEARSS
jgi:hypothetical protein